LGVGPRVTVAGPRVAVVGSGIAGLGACHALRGHVALTLFEAEGRCGGHARTVDLALQGHTHGVDTGFLVFNHHTYPRLTRLFGELGIATAPAQMSFSVQADGLEWSGASLAAVFAQRRNLLRPRFWCLLAELLRFNRLATALAERGDEAALQQTVGEFLDACGFGKEFREAYFLPMVACIWSCPSSQMLRFPLATLLRFCHQHGLLQVNGRPQ
jgi:predicted NAD/FAD-binding protein